LKGTRSTMETVTTTERHGGATSSELHTTLRAKANKNYFEKDRFSLVRKDQVRCTRWWGGKAGLVMMQKHT